MNGRYKIATLGFVAFVTSFGAHVVAVNLPVYAGQAHVGVAMIGLLIAVYDIAEIFAKPIFGFLADRTGLKRTMLAGLAVFSLASLAYLFVDPHLLLGIRLLQGLGAAALSIVSAALVAEYFPDSRGKAFGIYNALKGTGYVISPVLGGAIVWATSFREIFLASFAAGAVAFLLSLALPEHEGKREEGTGKRGEEIEQGEREERRGNRGETILEDDDDDFSLRQFVAAFRERALLPWYALIVINMFLVGILFGFLPVYVHSLHYNQLANGLIVGAVTVSYLLVQPVAGHLADRFDPLKVIFAGLALAAAGVTLVPLTAGAALVAVGIGGGLGVGTVWTNTDAMVSHLARQDRMASTLGAAGSFKELGDMLGPLLIGLLAQGLGIRAGFVICGALGFLALGLVGFVRGHGRNG